MVEVEVAKKIRPALELRMKVGPKIAWCDVSNQAMVQRAQNEHFMSANI